MPATFAYARHVRSTAHANNRFSVHSSPPLYLSRKNASFQAGFGPIHTCWTYPVYWDAISHWLSRQPIHPLSFVGEIWGTCGVDKCTCPLEIEKSTSCRLLITCCDGQSTFEGNSWLKTSYTRHTYSTSTTALLGPVHSSHSWYVATDEEAKQFWASIRCPGTLYTLVCLANPKHI